MTVSALSPCRTALRRERCFPAFVVGPVLLSEFRRLASNCLKDVIDGARLNWLRFAIRTLIADAGPACDQPCLAGAGDESLATVLERRRSDRFWISATKQLTHRSDGLH